MFQKGLSQVKKSMAALALTFFLGMTVAIPVSSAQFAPPTLLPGDDQRISGFGDACAGLALAIREGQVTLRQIPCFIKFFSQTLIAIAGSLSVIFVMIGGYGLVVSVDESRDKAKKTIQYALIGLVVSLMAWILVGLVLQFVTE